MELQTDRAEPHALNRPQCVYGSGARQEAKSSSEWKKGCQNMELSQFVGFSGGKNLFTVLPYINKLA